MALWIRVDSDIWDNPKVWSFGLALVPWDVLGDVRHDVPPQEMISDERAITLAVGYLAALWHRVAQYRPNGDVGDVPDGLLEQWARWHGRPGRFAELYRKAFAPNGIINDWERYQGRAIHERERERERKRRQRAQDRAADVPPAVPPDSPRDKSRMSRRNEDDNDIREESVPGGDRRAPARLALTGDEQSVVNHYRTVHPKRLRGAIPPKLLRVIRSALENYPVEDVCRAIDGNAASQFHRDNGHLGLDLILRDATKIDYFLALAGKAEAEVKVMTDENGVDRPHRRSQSGEWVPAA